MRRCYRFCAGSTLFALVLAGMLGSANAQDAVSSAPIRVASKNFNESYILSEVVAQLLESRGYEVERRFGLGGTLICYQALANDEIDVYVEYTGTLAQAILEVEDVVEVAELNALLEVEDLELLEPFGFNNTYAIVLKRAKAERLALRTISDLVEHQELSVVVSHEFLEREDGWPGLAARYGFRNTPTGIEHGLAYQAIEQGAIDVTDAYSTDGELARYDLALLRDDLNFFPPYLAAPLVRKNLSADVLDTLRSLGATLDDATMAELNARVVFGNDSFATVAADFLGTIGVESEANSETITQELLRHTLTHLKLTVIALGMSIITALGLALLVFRVRTLSRAVLYLCGLLQTIPSIALLALMIPLLGIGAVPAIVALFLYALLPILRNAITALTTIDPTIVRVAVSMGLSEVERLRYVFVPLSLPSVLAGIRTAAVISIGTATLAAFIGAGGLGEPIVTGLALNDVNLILRGAIPAALLAVVTELLFEGIERLVLPKHLQVTNIDIGSTA